MSGGDEPETTEIPVSTIKSTATSPMSLNTYNSAADLTNQELFVLDKDEYLFDLNTKHSCIRPLENFIKLFSTSTVSREFASFTSLQLTRPRVIDAFFDHPQLNKYGEIGVYEQTRVRAKHSKGHNYINANWIDGFREIRKFIVAQSPLDASVAQFWRMMHERRSQVLVASVELVTETKQPIVPRKIGEILKFEEMSVELVHVRNIRPTYCSAMLKVSNEKDVLNIVLLAHHGWGLAGYPYSPCELLDLIADMNNMREITRKIAIEEKRLDPKQAFPITVICFDGIGRSCTIVALDILCQRLVASSKIGTPFVDVLDTIARLRMVRAGACAKAEHYIFLSFAILEFAIRRHIITVEKLPNIDLTGFMITDS